MHHRWFLAPLLALLAALSAAAQDNATQAPVLIIEKSIREGIPTTESTQSTQDIQPLETIKPEATEEAPPPPRLALLLPLKSRLYGRAAEAVRDGFVAAAEQRPDSERLPIWEYPVDDNAQSLLAGYARAAAEGARIIVGPLTREGVSVLAKSGQLTVPTLALNYLDGTANLGTRNLHTMGLSLEAEARQAATLARGAGKCSAAILYPDSALGKRLQSAFAEEWQKSQCQVLAEQRIARDLAPDVLKSLRTDLAQQPVDVVFVAGDSEFIKRLRSYIKASLPIYATSQAYRGKLDAGERREFRGVYFVDMPWLLQSDHAAVAIYPPPKKALSNDLQRFYALGIDAYRVTQQMLADGEPLRAPLDGVTGRLSRGAEHLIIREALPAVYLEDGSAALLTAPQ